MEYIILILLVILFVVVYRTEIAHYKKKISKLENELKQYQVLKVGASNLQTYNLQPYDDWLREQIQQHNQKKENETIIDVLERKNNENTTN